MDMSLDSVLGLATREAIIQMAKGDGTYFVEPEKVTEETTYLYQGGKYGPGCIGEKLVF